MITQTYDINMIPGGVPVRVAASQRDTGSRTIVFNLFNGSETFAPSNAYARVDGTRADGAAFTTPATLSGSTATWVMSLDMTAAAGEGKAELVIVDTSGNVLGSKNFVIDIEPYTKDPEAEPTTEEITVWEQMYNQSVTQAEAAQTAANEAASSAIAAATSATNAASSASSAADTVTTIQAMISQLQANVIDAVYPVGSVYISASSTSPATLFGGTWEQVKDTFLLAAGDTYTVGATGGEATHTLTENEIPEHSHSVRARISGYYSASGTDDYVSNFRLYDYDSTSLWETRTTSSTGGGAAHNNMPPYLAVYVWRRTA